MRTIESAHKAFYYKKSILHQVCIFNPTIVKLIGEMMKN